MTRGKNDTSHLNLKTKKTSTNLPLGEQSLDYQLWGNDPKFERGWEPYTGTFNSCKGQDLAYAKRHFRVHIKNIKDWAHVGFAIYVRGRMWTGKYKTTVNLVKGTRHIYPDIVTNEWELETILRKPKKRKKSLDKIK